MNDSIRTSQIAEWALAISRALGHDPFPEQIAAIAELLDDANATDDELEQLRSAVLRESTRLPSPSMFRDILSRRRGEAHRKAPPRYLGTCGREDARAAFLAGWIESGADPAKAEAWFREIDRSMHHAISDYDDSDNAAPIDLFAE